MHRVQSIMQISDCCNLACNYCYLNPRQEDMSFETYKNAHDKMTEIVDEGVRSQSR
jgi:sulfatase maturation enzyme AslB (radical SAM superfamily)